MELKNTDYAGIPVLKISGQVNANNAKELIAALNALDATGKLILDVSAMDYISSAGLSAFIMASEHFRKGGGQMAVFGPSRPVQNIFELVELHQRVPIMETLELASAELG